MKNSLPIAPFGRGAQRRALTASEIPPVQTSSKSPSGARRRAGFAASDPPSKLIVLSGPMGTPVELKNLRSIPSPSGSPSGASFCHPPGGGTALPGNREAATADRSDVGRLLLARDEAVGLALGADEGAGRGQPPPLDTRTVVVGTARGQARPDDDVAAATVETSDVGSLLNASEGVGDLLGRQRSSRGVESAHPDVLIVVPGNDKTSSRARRDIQIPDLIAGGVGGEDAAVRLPGGVEEAAIDAQGRALDDRVRNLDCQSATKRPSSRRAISGGPIVGVVVMLHSPLVGVPSRR